MSSTISDSDGVFNASYSGAMCGRRCKVAQRKRRQAAAELRFQRPRCPARRLYWGSTTQRPDGGETERVRRRRRRRAMISPPPWRGWPRIASCAQPSLSHGSSIRLIAPQSQRGYHPEQAHASGLGGFMRRLFLRGRTCTTRRSQSSRSVASFPGVH